MIRSHASSLYVVVACEVGLEKGGIRNRLSENKFSRQGRREWQKERSLVRCDERLKRIIEQEPLIGCEGSAFGGRGGGTDFSSFSSFLLLHLPLGGWRTANLRPTAADQSWWRRWNLNLNENGTFLGVVPVRCEGQRVVGGYPGWSTLPPSPPLPFKMCGRISAG